METQQIIGMAFAIALILGMSVYSGIRKKQKSSEKIGASIISGVIMGTLVGGSSTIGTAQLAYDYGMSAWWFTIGSGIGCLFLALAFSKPFRNTGKPTLVAMIEKEYGSKAGFTATILSSVGTFINLIPQIIGATAVIAVVAPQVDLITSVFLSALFMVLYVVFGGTRGAGMVGVVKSILLYVTMISCGIIVLSLSGGVNSFVKTVEGIDNPAFETYFSLYNRGAGKDLGSAISVLFGVFTGQTYAQAVIYGKTDKAGRNGALAGAFLIPPIGIGGILVGLYMRANYPGIVAKTALTTFVMEHMPPLLGGIVLGTLLITVVGAGAGIALGVATVINNDIVKKYTRKFDDPTKNSILSKVLIIVLVGLAGFMSTGIFGDTMLNFGFLSMGLRSAVIFAPLCCALWLPGRIDKKFAIFAALCGPIAVLISELLKLPLDSLFAGIAVNTVIMVIGLLVGKHEKKGSV